MKIGYKTRKLPKDPGPAAWDAILPEAPIYPQLDDDIACDWLLIGSDFAGLSAARRLHQFRGGDRIVVNDATRIAQGPAGRNSGFMIDLPHDLSSDQYTSSLDKDLWQIKLNRQAIDFAKDVAEEFNLPEETVDAQGRINGAVTDAGLHHNQEYAAHLERLGESFEMLDEQAMHEVTGSRFYSAGLYMPGTVLLQPA